MTILEGFSASKIQFFWAGHFKIDQNQKIQKDGDQTKESPQFYQKYQNFDHWIYDLFQTFPMSA